MHNLPIFARPVLHRVSQSLHTHPPVNLSLVGGPLMGKSTILAHIASVLSSTDEDSHPVVQVNCMQVRPGVLPPDTPREGKRWTVLLDDLDHIAQWNRDDRHRWIDWLVAAQPDRDLVLASKRPLHQFGVWADLSITLPNVQQFFLGLMNSTDATQIIQAAIPTQADSEPIVSSLAEWCGGHPFLLDQVADLFADIRGMLPGNRSIGPIHLPLLRMRLATAHGQMLFDSQLQAVENSDDERKKPLIGLLHQLLHRGVPFNELSPAQAEPMNWLLVQGLAGIDDQRYRLFSPLFQEYLATKLPISRATRTELGQGQSTTHTLVNQESHRFTPQEKSLLLYFLDRPRTIISTDELLANVWQQPDGSVRRVQEGIRRLRHRLAEFNGAIGAIENEWGQGYRYVPVNGLD